MLITMNLSVRDSVTLFAGALSALYSCSLALSLLLIRGTESNSVDSAAWIVPFTLSETCRQSSKCRYPPRGAWEGDAYGSSFPPRRAVVPRSFVSERFRSKRRRARTLHVAGVPVVPGDTRDLFRKTAGDDDENSTQEEDANEGAAALLRIESVVSRDAEIAGQRVLLRVAHLDDYLDIADVRFDVFSPVHNTLKHRFRERSFVLMRERRRRGAFCLVVTLIGKAVDIDGSGCSGDQERKREDGEVEAGVSSRKHILGTLECSMHEFDGTPLAVETGGIADKITRLYLTEVAVRSDCRRLGVGRHLMRLVDDVARELETSEVFLHVNEVNTAALGLYAACGYEEAPDSAPNRCFTNSLGLAGGFIGQRHRLLHKTFPTGSSGSSGERDSASLSQAPAA